MRNPPLLKTRLAKPSSHRLGSYLSTQLRSGVAVGLWLLFLTLAYVAVATGHASPGVWLAPWTVFAPALFFAVPGKWPARLDVLRDGLVYRWLWFRWYIPFADVTAIRVEKNELTPSSDLVILRSGQRRFVLPGVRKSWLNQQVRRLEFEVCLGEVNAALARFRQREVASMDELSVSAQRGPSRVHYLRSLGAGSNLDMRTAPVSQEALWSLVENPRSKATERAAAAVALSAAGDAETGERFAEIARWSAHPKLRIVLEKAVRPDDEELASALAELEAEEEANARRDTTTDLAAEPRRRVRPFR